MSVGHPHWILENSEGVILRIHIQPKASRSEIVGEYRQGESVRLKIRIAAPPVDGAANEALLRFLKEATGLPSSRIHLIRGTSSRSKDILIQNVSVSEIIGRLRF